MKRLLSLLLALPLFACGQTGPALERGEGAFGAQAKAKVPSFTLATYNVENLFDGSNVELDGKLRKAKSEKDKQLLAASMRELNADVVGLVEVESRATLRNFRDSYLKDMGYRYLSLIEGNDFRGIDVAVMSRFPITHLKSHKNLSFGVPQQDEGPQELSRDLLQARIEVGKGYSFTLFMTHLKAQIGGAAADAKRLAEAQAIRRVLRDYESAHPRDNYAVMGDLNDVPGSEPIKTLLGERERDPKLLDVLSELGPQSYTYHPIKYRGRIDYMLLSPGMAPDYVKGSARIHESANSLAASDHLPATITLDASQDR